jgi:predicted nucleic acid-binding Zn ribbon protein
MALLTPAELKKLPFDVRNRWKHKCDKCTKVIQSTLIYGADNGQEACSESCKNILNKEKENYMAKKKDEEEVEKSESSESSESSSETPKKAAKKKAPAKKAAGRPKKEEAPAKKKAGRPKKEEAEEESESEKKSSNKDKKKSKKSKHHHDDDEKPKKARESNVGTKDNPYREGSFIHDAFELAKGGCTVKAMKKLCEKKEVDYNWTLARFKKGEKRDVTWKFTIDETDMRIKLKK